MDLHGKDVSNIKYKYHVDELVREEESLQKVNWTEEIFTIAARNGKDRPTYKLKDHSGELLDGSFYEEEIQKVIKKDNIYRIERILKRRRKNNNTFFLVKWKGYPDKFNSWVNEKDMQNL